MIIENNTEIMIMKLNENFKTSQNWNTTSSFDHYYIKKLNCVISAH